MTDQTEQQNVIVTLTKEESKLVNWLRKSLGNDEARPVLTAMYVNGTDTVCCDGYRIIIAPTPAGLQIEQLANRAIATHGNFKAGVPTAVSLLPDNTRYPDYKAVLPTETTKPLGMFLVDPKYWADALSGYAQGTAVKVTLYENCISVVGDVDGIEVKSVVMAMHDNTGKSKSIETYSVYPAPKVTTNTDTSKDKTI
jgi:hypothetical protein